MANSTCSKSNLDHLEDAIAKLFETQMLMSTKLDDLYQKLAVMESTQPSPTSSSAHPPSPSPSAQPHRIKLEVPHYDGFDPVVWLFKINQFFDYHVTLEHDCLMIPSFYMDGQALAWYQWMTCNGQITSWPSLLQALEAHFGPSNYEYPTGSLFKLTQQGSVNDYLSAFEALPNRIIGLPPPFLLNYFISGFSPEICREVEALQPLSYTQAAALGHLQEEKFLDCHYSRPRPFPQSSFVPRPSQTILNPTPPLLPPPPFLPTPPKPSVPFKLLSLEEIAIS